MAENLRCWLIWLSMRIYLKNLHIYLTKYCLENLDKHNNLLKLEGAHYDESADKMKGRQWESWAEEHCGSCWSVVGNREGHWPGQTGPRLLLFLSLTSGPTIRHSLSVFGPCWRTTRPTPRLTSFELCWLSNSTFPYKLIALTSSGIHQFAILILLIFSFLFL